MKYLIVLILFAGSLFAQDKIIDRYFPCGISDSTVWVFKGENLYYKDYIVFTKNNRWYLPLTDYAKDIKPFPYKIVDEKITCNLPRIGFTGYVTIADFSIDTGEWFSCFYAVCQVCGEMPNIEEHSADCRSTDTTIVTKFDTLKHCYLFNSSFFGSYEYLRYFNYPLLNDNIYYAPGIGFASPNLVYAKIGNKEYGHLPDGMTQKDLRNPITSVPNVKGQIPGSFTLAQNYPNPFNSETVIEFNLPQFSEINLAVYDVSGREIKTILSGQLPPGAYSEKWNGTDNSGNAVASGVYFIRLKSGQYSKFIKAVYSK